MSSKQIVDRILANTGIQQVHVRDNATAIMHSGNDADPRSDVTRQVMGVYVGTKMPESMRVVIERNDLGHVTVACFRSERHSAAVMLETGHPIAKSLRRLVMRAFNAGEKGLT